ncbi:MAG: lysylphosphatidylglycerol synthase transmembrane domain-containing protein [Candidatus Pacearchaeota archaeon]|nr:lysylphosphatidylglycerol synthase transmembrane domain-containing protein [Candidatus Pacearchaeota archaeon]
MKIKKYLPIIGLVIFAYLLIKLDVLKIIKEIANVNVFFLLVAVFFSIISILAETMKWFVVARYQKIKVPFFEAVGINLIGGFYGFITPSKVGNIIRAEYLKKYSNDKRGKGISNFVLDKILDVCSLVLLVIVFSFVSLKFLSANYLYFSILGLVFLLACLFIFMDRERSKRILKIFHRLVSKKLKEKARRGFYSFYEDMPKKRYLFLFFFVYLLNWVVAYSVMFFIGLSIQINNVSFFYFLALLPIATLVAQIPITISGLGTRELTTISLFGLLGVQATKVFSMSIIGLVIGNIIPAVIGFFLSLINGKKTIKQK